MLNYKNHKNDQGFTLIELMIVLIVIGIIAAIAAPNFIGLLYRNRVNEDLSNLVGAIKETQRQAMFLGQRCVVRFNTSTNEITTDSDGCLLANRRLNSEIVIRTNLPGSTPGITFSHKGSTTNMGTIVVSNEYTDLQKCFVISLGTGITRTGTYTGSNTGSISFDDCEPD